MTVNHRPGGGAAPPAVRRTSRREFLAASGGALVGVSLLGAVACGGDDDGAGGAAGGPGEVIVSLGGNLADVVRGQAKRFNEEHPDGPKITVRIMSDVTDDYFTKLRTQFQAGGGDISVIVGDVIWPAQFAQPGWIADLSARFTAEKQQEFLPGTVEAMVFEDKVWGVPWYTDSGLLFYRQDLLEASGYSEAPTTWEQLREMAAKVQRDAGIGAGFVFTGAAYEGGTVLGTEFIRNAGGDILDGDQVVIASPEAVEGLTIQQSLVADGVAPEAVAEFTEDEATGAFGRGDAVFMRMWPFYYTDLADPEISTLEQSQVGLAQLPVTRTGIQPVNVGGGWNFYINAASDDEDAAWEVVEFLTAPEQQKEMALEASVLPTRTSLYEDAEILEKMPAVALGKDAILNTTTPPVSPYYSDMSLAMAAQFNANILGDVTPEEAVETLEQELTSIIERGG
jgi:multiple sugar transport system substrate-binding protein